jgi:hypothetical protein
LTEQQILNSAYKLNGSASHLEETYGFIAQELVPWQPAKIPIQDDEDLFQHLGDKGYQRAFIEYFDRRLREFDGDWRQLVNYYLLDGPHPMIGGLVGGFSHPMILLADAVDVSNPRLAVEALAMAAYDWNALHKVIEAPLPEKKPAVKQTPLEVLHEMREDQRFDGLLQKPGVRNTPAVLQDAGARKAVLDHLNALDLDLAASEDVNALLKEFVEAAVLLLCTTHTPRNDSAELAPHKFDMYLTHQLTFCWSLQILLPFFPANATPRLLRIGWLMMVLTYVTQLRPQIKPQLLADTLLPDQSWNEAWARMTNVAVGTSKDKGMDPHFVKVIRTLKEFAHVWSDREEVFLKASVRFEGEFAGWTGFGEDDEEYIDIHSTDQGA